MKLVNSSSHKQKKITFFLIKLLTRKAPIVLYKGLLIECFLCVNNFSIVYWVVSPLTKKGKIKNPEVTFSEDELLYNEPVNNSSWRPSLIQGALFSPAYLLCISCNYISVY